MAWYRVGIVWRCNVMAQSGEVKHGDGNVPFSEVKHGNGKVK